MMKHWQRHLLAAAVIHSPPTHVREGPRAVGLFGTRSSHPWALDVRHPWLPTVPKHVGAKNLSPHSPSGPLNAVPTPRVGRKNQPLCMVLGGKWIMALAALPWLLLLASLHAQAHPHAWIDLRVSLEWVAEQSQGPPTRLVMHQEWWLDPTYSLLILEDFEREQPGLDLEQALDQLGQDLLQRLARYTYFTELRANEQPLPIPQAQAPELTLEQRRLRLRFSLPVAWPENQQPDHTRVDYRVYDPSYWIEVLHDPYDVIHVVTPPTLGLNCAASIAPPRPDPALVMYAATLLRDQRAPIDDLGRPFAEVVTLTCSGS